MNQTTQLIKVHESSDSVQRVVELFRSVSSFLKQKYQTNLTNKSLLRPKTRGKNGILLPADEFRAQFKVGKGPWVARHCAHLITSDAQTIPLQKE